MVAFPRRQSPPPTRRSRRASRVLSLLLAVVLLSISLRQVPARADAPIANPDTGSTDEDTILNVAAPGLLGNDTDPDGDPLTVTDYDTTSDQGATVTVGEDGSYTYDPTGAVNLQALAEGESIDDTFSYTVSDGVGGTDTTTVTITVGGINDPPVAADDSYSTPEDTPLAVAAQGVLANDTDADGDPLTAILAIGPASGTLVLNANGSFVYTPALNYNGVVTFTYQANDGMANSNTATVTITVTPVNDPPVAADDSYSTPEDTPLTIAAPGVLANDTDADGDPLTAILAIGPTSGTLVLNANGSFVYTPAPDFNGVVTFTYQANDGIANSNVATVTITVTPVNDPPVAHDQTVTTNEDTPVDITLTASDVDGDPLTYSIVAGPSHGTLSGTPPDVTYTPKASYNGADSFKFRVNDGITNSKVATVTITVIPVNDPPVAMNDAYTTPEDTPLTVAAPGVLANDTDADSDPLTAVLVTGPASGTLVFNTNGSFTYTPAPNYNGVVTFTYRANDGTANSNTATVTITVTPVNDPPVAVDDTGSTDEDTVLTVTAPGVLGNDTDPDAGDTLRVTNYSSTSAQGAAVTVGANGGYTYDPTGAANLQALAAGETISDTFTYTVGDGNGGSDIATVEIAVQGLNDRPTAYDDQGTGYTTDEDTPFVTDNVLDNDTDPDRNDSLSVIELDATGVLGQLTNNGDGTFGYDPNDQFEYLGNGEQVVETFVYTITDRYGGTAWATVSIVVHGVNDAPVAGDNRFLVQEDSIGNLLYPLVNDSDVEGDRLTITQATPPTSGTIAIVQGGTALAYTPRPDFYGYDSVTYTISDGNGGSATATITIEVENVNDNPLARPDTIEIDEDSGYNLIDVLHNDTYLPDPPETLTIAGFTRPQHGTVTIVNNGAHLQYRPNDDFYGIDTFTYTIADGNGGYATASVHVTVRGINDPPNAEDDSASTQEDTPVTIDVLKNDSDIDGQLVPSTVTVISGPSHGSTRVDTSSGKISYTPDRDWHGDDSFVYRVCDNGTPLPSKCDTATVYISVGWVNDPPISNAGPDQRVDTLSLVTLDGSGSYDPDNNYPLTYLWSQTGGPAVMLSSVTAAKPTFTAPGDPGVLTFALRVIDSAGRADDTPDETVVTVRNQPPIANAGPDQTVQAGSLVTLDGTGSTDPDHDLPLTYMWAQTGGPTVTLSGATTARPSFTAPDERTVLTFSLLVVDAFGEPSPTPDQVVIQVHKPYAVFMPMVAHRHAVAPDLVIQSITARSNSIELVIANQGNAPVRTEFWVDVYINPRVAPTAVNQPWYDLGNQGLVWGVFGPGLSALKPGSTLTLKTGDPYYFADYSKVSWPLPAGTPIYGQVDSFADTSYGTVHELDEILGRPYNNIHGPILSAAGVAAERMSFGKAPDPTAVGNLPPRP